MLFRSVVGKKLDQVCRFPYNRIFILNECFLIRTTTLRLLHYQSDDCSQKMSPHDVRTSNLSSVKDADERKFNQTLTELNIQVAQFRDLLLAVGSAKDCPDLRERIRKVRMEAVEDVMRTNNSLLPHVKK